MAGPSPLLKGAIDPALSKVLNMMGPDRGRAAIADAMRRASLTSLQTPDDRLRFACALMESGGICAAIGRAIKIQAILHGASADPSTAD